MRTGPYLPPFHDLAAAHPLEPPAVELYSGTNPMTGKPVKIYYLPLGQTIRVSTYYADTPNSIDKPYIFSIANDYQVTHETW